MKEEKKNKRNYCGWIELLSVETSHNLVDFMIDRFLGADVKSFYFYFSQTYYGFFCFPVKPKFF